MKIQRCLLSAFVLGSGALAFGQTPSQSSNYRIAAEQKISETSGGLVGTLSDADFFGLDVASAGDLNGDGRPEVVVCAPEDDDGGTDRGAVWILFMNADGTVQSEQKVSDTAGGFLGLLGDTDQFGRSAVSLGDLDGDTVPDIAVGAYRLDDGQFDAGGLFVLLMNANGTVKSHVRISNLFGGFGGSIGESDLFGLSVACLDDLDGDNVDDIAVGALQDDGMGGSDRGAVWVLLMNSNGTVKSEVKIGDGSGGFTGVLSDDDKFGSSVATLGDLDGDGVCDLAVGATGDDDGGTGRGAVWVLFLDTDGTVKSHAKISDTQGGFRGIVDDADNFGHSLSFMGDLDRNGRPNLAVGVWRDDDGGNARGSVWVLDLNADGTAASHFKISDTKGGFDSGLDDGDGMGVGVGCVGDLDQNGTADLMAGAFGDDDGGPDRGAVWVFMLDAGPRDELFPPSSKKILGTAGNPDVLTEIDPAWIGDDWAGEVEASSTLTYLLTGSGVRDAGPVFDAGVRGELLLELPLTVTAIDGTFELSIPRDPSLVGESLDLQAAYLDGATFQLTNALAVGIGGELDAPIGLAR